MCVWGGHFQGFVRVTMTLSCDRFCFSSGVRGLDVEQSPPALSLQEGASHMLRCNFSGSVTNVQWYLQNPSGRLIHLFNVPSGTKQDGRLKATTIPTERSSSLHVSSSQTTDSGTSVLRSTVLPRHLQPPHKPSAGLSPSPATVTP